MKYLLLFLLNCLGCSQGYKSTVKIDPCYSQPHYQVISGNSLHVLPNGNTYNDLTIFRMDMCTGITYSLQNDKWYKIDEQ